MPIPISGLWRKVEESNSYAQHVPQGSSLVADHPTAPSVSSVGRQDSVEDQHPSMPQPDHRCPAHRLGLFVLHPRWCERAEVGIAPSHLQQWCPDLPPGYPGAGLSHRRSCRPKESNLTSHQAPGLQPGRNPSSKIDESSTSRTGTEVPPPSVRLLPFGERSPTGMLGPGLISHWSRSRERTRTPMSWLTARHVADYITLEWSLDRESNPDLRHTTAVLSH